MSFKNKKILITGGTGSLGKELVRHLLKNEQPETVRIYDVDETEQFEFQHELKEYGGMVRFLLGDVRNIERLIHVAEDISAIFHTTIPEIDSQLTIGKII